MLANLIDLVKINIDNTGTGALVLGAPVEGYRGRPVLQNGQVYSYSIQQGGAWEFGSGTYLATGYRFIRSPIDSSDGGTAINLQPGAQVAFVALAKDLTGPVKALDPLIGSGEPGDETGTLGQIYFDRANGLLYGPKAVEGWGTGTSFVGPAGPADNTYTDLALFRASDVTLKVAKLVGIESIPDGEFFFKTDAPPYVEDGITTIKADSTRLDEGAWVRQKGNAIGYQWAGTPTDVDSALRNLPTLLDAFAKTTQTQIIAGTWTGDLSTAIRAAVQGKDHFVIPPGTFPFKGDIVEVTTPGLVVHGMGGVLKKMGGSGSDGVGILVSTHAQLLNIHIDATVPNPTLGSNFNDLVQVNFTPATPSSRVLIQNLKAKGSSSNVLVHRGGLLEVDGLFAWNTYANGLQLVASNMFGRRIRIYTTVTQNGIFATSSGGSLDTGDVISNVHLEDVYIENSADTGIELGYGCHDCTATNFITVNCVNPGALGRDNQRCTFRNGRIYAPAYSDQISSYNAVAMVPYFRGASYETGSSFEDIEVIGPCKVGASIYPMKRSD